MALVGWPITEEWVEATLLDLARDSKTLRVVVPLETPCEPATTIPPAAPP